MRDTCDCSTCKPGHSFISIGNPPHGWFRLAQYNLATTEDSYVWCCIACHALIFDRGTWQCLDMHRCSVKEVRQC